MSDVQTARHLLSPDYDFHGNSKIFRNSTAAGLKNSHICLTAPCALCMGAYEENTSAGGTITFLFSTPHHPLYVEIIIQPCF